MHKLISILLLGCVVSTVVPAYSKRDFYWHYKSQQVYLRYYHDNGHVAARTSVLMCLKKEHDSYKESHEPVMMCCKYSHSHFASFVYTGDNMSCHGGTATTCSFSDISLPSNQFSRVSHYCQGIY